MKNAMIGLVGLALTSPASAFLLGNTPLAKEKVALIQSWGYDKDIAQCAISLVDYMMRCDGLEVNESNAKDWINMGALTCIVHKSEDPQGVKDIVFTFEHGLQMEC